MNTLIDVKICFKKISDITIGPNKKTKDNKLKQRLYLKNYNHIKTLSNQFINLSIIGIIFFSISISAFTSFICHYKHLRRANTLLCTYMLLNTKSHPKYDRSKTHD